MAKQYKLTHSEYVTVTSALKHARESAVNPDAKAKYSAVLKKLMREYEQKGE